MKIDLGQSGVGRNGINLVISNGKYPFLTIRRDKGRFGIQYEFEFVCHMRLYVTDWPVGENLYISGGVRIDEDLGNWKCGEKTSVFEEGPMCIQVRKEIRGNKEYAIVTRLYDVPSGSSNPLELWRQYITELGPVLSDPAV